MSLRMKTVGALMLSAGVAMLAPAQAEDVIRIGYTNNPGFLSSDGEGNYQGFVYDYLESLKPYLNSSFEYVQCSYEDCERRLINGEVDVLQVLVGREQDKRYLPFSLSAEPISSTATVYLEVKPGFDPALGVEKIKVGYLDRVASESVLRETLQRQGYPNVDKLSFIPYSLSEDLRTDFFGGSLDARVHNYYKGEPGSEDVSLSAQLFNADIYLAMRLGNKNVKERLDNAMVSLKLVAPQFEDLLNVQHLHSGRPLLLTAEESAYLKDHPEFSLGGPGGMEPFSYYADEGEYRGVVRKILDQMSEDLGVKFLYKDHGGAEQLFASLNEGRVDLATVVPADYNWAREKNLALTLPYLWMDYVRVHKINATTPSQPKVAVVRPQSFIEQFIRKIYPEAQILHFDNAAQCLWSVSTGLADLTFMDSVSVQQALTDGGYYDLESSGATAFSHPICLGMNSGQDPLLIRILNKEISHLDPAQLQKLQQQAAFNVAGSHSLTAFIYHHPFLSLALVIALALLILGGMAYVLMLRRKSEEQVKQVAYTNPQTGLHNLRWFEKEVPQVIEELHAERRTGALYLVVVSIRQTELLNKTYDHFILNEAFKNWIGKLCTNNASFIQTGVSSELMECYHLCLVQDDESIMEMLRKLDLTCSYVEIGGTVVRVENLYGVCKVPSIGTVQISQLLSSAKIARDEAVSRGENIGIYSVQSQNTLMQHQRIENLMEKALREREFEIWLQPKYNIKTRKTIGAEALVRWDSPELGFMGPGLFIDLFEKNGFIIKLDYHNLIEVRKLQAERARQGLPVVPISVNQSGIHFSEEGYLEKMAAIVEEYPIPPGSVELEITETSFVDMYTHETRASASNIIAALRGMGYQISIDDFSKGYSSLYTLLTLQLDIIKIDRAMLLAAESSDKARRIMHGIVDLVDMLELKVICEGIETPEQEQLLLDSGCIYGQGFLYGKPMPQPQFSAFLAEHV